MDHFNTMDFDVFISALSYLGTLSFAISGFITASKKQLDLFGALGLPLSPDWVVAP